MEFADVEGDPSLTKCILLYFVSTFQATFMYQLTRFHLTHGDLILRKPYMGNLVTAKDGTV